MGRWRRGGRLAAAAALALASACPAARSGPGGSPLDRYKLHPAYSTTYDVLRDQKTWKQKLTLDRALLTTDFKSQFEVMKKQDKRRNDYEQTQRKVGLDAERKRGSLRIYTTADFDRDRVDQTISSRQVDSDNVTLGGESTLLSRGSSSLKFQLNGGLVRNHELNIRRRSNGYTADSTDASGLRGGGGVSGELSRGEVLQCSANLIFDAAQKKSESIHEDLTGSSRTTTPKSATDRDRQVTVSSTTRWTHFDEAKVQLQGSYADGTSQYYQASQQGQETRLTQRRDVSLLVEGELTSTLYYSMILTHKFNLLDYELEKRDRQSRDSDLAMEAGYKINGVPILSGTDIVWTLTAGEGETKVETGNDFRSERAQLSGELTRPLGSELTLTAKDPVQALRKTVLSMTFDGERTVESPLGDFFGAAPGLNTYESLPLGVTKEGEIVDALHLLDF